MTNPEFSAQFDVLWNNVTSNQAPGLNEYEKSVFLTKAEYQLVNEYFNNRTDAVGGGFDGSQKRQYDFSGLIRTETLFYLNKFKERVSATEKLDRRSFVYLFPMNYFLAVNEILQDNSLQFSVMPLDYSEYQRLMLKPYNLPVKRGAWRLFTDKKNCNYVHVDSTGKELEDDDNSVSADYKIMSSWADQKRTLEIYIVAHKQTRSVVTSALAAKYPSASTASYNDFAWDNKTVQFDFRQQWDDTKMVYQIGIGVTGTEDDEEVIECLKSLFEKAMGGEISIDDVTTKVMEHLDGMSLCSAPSKKKLFFNVPEGETSPGYTFETHVVQVPMAEIIGKFDGVPVYKLRFVRKLMPIILEDLDNYGDDQKINGISKATECILPEECHQEILERAVTLAKIAWQGGTATQAAAAQNNRRGE